MLRFSLSCLVLLGLFSGTTFGALIHQYTFNDGTAADSVGTAHGIPVNNTIGNPIFGNSQAIFSRNDGTNTSPVDGQYIDLPNGIAAHRALTVETWTTFRGGNRWQRIVDFGNCSAGELLPSDKTTTTYDAYSNGFLILTPLNNQDHLLGQITVQPTGMDYSWTLVTMELDREYHMVFTHDPDSGEQRLYLDGLLVGSDTATVDPSANVPPWTNYFIGRSNFSTNAFYNGSVNELRLYDHALSAADAQLNHLAGPTVPEPAAFAIWGALGILAMIAAHRGRRHGARS